MPGLSDPKTWVTQYGNVLFRYAYLRINNASLAEDLVQETFLAALKARSRFAGHSSEKTWLIGILKHKIIDHMRRSRKERQVENIESEADRNEEVFDKRGRWNTGFSEWSDPDRSFEKREFWEAFSRCVADLPPHLADLFILREIKGMPSEDVCKVLEISTTNNMWVMLSRARMRLRKCMEARWFEAMGKGK